MNKKIKTFSFAAFFTGISIFVPSLVYAEKTISVGIFPRRDVENTIHMHTPMAEYLSEKIGFKVQLKTSRNFEIFWGHVTNKRFDVVHYNPYHYVKSAKEYGYRVILKNEENGLDKQAGAIFVNKDSGISNIAELKGKRIVFGGGPTAMFSYLMPTYMLQKIGMNEGDYIKGYAISPPKALVTAYYGHADAAGAGITVPSFETIKRKIDIDKLHAIAVSEYMTHLPWAVRDDLDEKLVKKIQIALSELALTERGKHILRTAGLTGLNVSNDKEYDEHRKIIWLVRQENYCVRNCSYISE